MLRIRRVVDGKVVFKLSGQLDKEHIAELERLIDLEGKRQEIVLDFEDVTLVGRDAITFLIQCEADNIAVVKCAPYIREWITLQRGGG